MRSSCKHHLPVIAVAILLVAVGQGQSGATAPLAINDIAWLFPPPQSPGDLTHLISIKAVTGPPRSGATGATSVWSESAFKNFLEIVDSADSEVNGNQIGLPPEAASIDGWFIAGVRIDPGAPGLSEAIRSEFGQAPEIRLIIQPVGKDANGNPVVFDIAAHLVFNFVLGQDPPVQNGCLARPKPDLDTFRQIVADLAIIRTRLRTGGFGINKVITDGVPLGVHPGLLDSTTAVNLRQEMLVFLNRYLSPERLAAMAVIGVPKGNPSPWLFVSMARTPTGDFVAAPSPALDGHQAAQMFSGGGAAIPEPHANNLNLIVCNNAVMGPDSLPVSARNGASTSQLFASPMSVDRKEQILSLIIDPTRSHFFNTDCVSCHTETFQAKNLGQNTFAQLDSRVLPTGPYTVRNFGWAPPIDGLRSIATRRTAAEAGASLEYINTNLLR